MGTGLRLMPGGRSVSRGWIVALALSCLLSAKAAYGWRWVQVNLDGFGDPANNSIEAMTRFSRGIVVGTRNLATGAQLWWSPVGFSDHHQWVRIDPPGFGANGNTSVRSLAVFRGYLYVGTESGEIWRGFRNGQGWFFGAVDPPGWVHPGRAVESLAVSGGFLYASRNHPAGIWRTWDGVTWTGVSWGGFGDTANNVGAWLAANESVVYALTHSENSGDRDRGCEVRRKGVKRYFWPLLNERGFGDLANYGRSILISEGALYVGTINQGHGGPGDPAGGQIWRYDGYSWEDVSPCIPSNGDPIVVCTPRAQSMAGNGSALWAGFGGGKMGYPGVAVLASTDGRTWSYATDPTRDGFGDTNNLTVSALAWVKDFDGVLPVGRLYAATTNDVTGAEVWMRVTKWDPPTGAAADP